MKRFVILLLLLIPLDLDASCSDEISERSPSWQSLRCETIKGFAELQAKLDAVLTCQRTSGRPKPRTESIKAYRKFSDSVLDTIQWDVDPCDDFFLHVCGNFKPDRQFLPKHASKNIMDRIQTLLEAEEIPDGISPKLENVISSMKHMVAASKKPSDSPENLGDIAEIVELLGGSPWLENTRNYSAELSNPFKPLHLLYKIWGMKSFLFFHISPAVENPSNNGIFLDFAPLINAFLDFSPVQATIGYAKVVGLELANGTETLGSVYPLKLMELVEKLDFDIYAEEKFTGMSSAEFEAKAPTVAKSLYEAPKSEEMQNVLRQMRVYSQTEHLEVLEKFVVENREFVQGWIVGDFLRTFFDSEGFFDLNNTHVFESTALHSFPPGTEFPENGRLYNSPEPIVERMYAQVYGPDDANEILQIRQGVEIIRRELIERIFELDWLDTTSKNKVLNKLSTVLPIIGYAPWIMKDEKLVEYYQDLPLLDGSESYVRMFRRFAENRFKEMVDKLALVRGAKSEYFLDGLTRLITEVQSPFDSNAFYNPITNTITLLQGLLAPPIFDMQFPHEGRVGRLGMIIGRKNFIAKLCSAEGAEFDIKQIKLDQSASRHELTHSVDTQGLRWDERGIEEDFLTPEFLGKFQERVQCFQDQMSEYCFPVEPTEQWNLTTFCLRNYTEAKNMGELLSDVGGIRAAYNALISFAQRPGIEITEIPGFENRSMEQIFFYSYASFWCSDLKTMRTGDGITKLYERGPHPPNPVRVTLSLQNFPAFSEAFRCPKGSRMNPEKKCQLW